MEFLSPVFEDRNEAGQLLAERLVDYTEHPNTLILALPRGGIPLGFILSERLHLPLDVLIARKLRAPRNPEFALGAMTETGYVYVNQEAFGLIGMGRDAFQTHFDQEIHIQEQEIVKRKNLYRSGNDLPTLQNTTVILVDDGVATGSTISAALHALKEKHVAKIIAAIPVSPPDTARSLAPLVDQLVVLCEPDNFAAVGVYYQRFLQVEDDEVLPFLEMARTHYPSLKAVS